MLTQLGMIAYGVLLGVRFSWLVGLLFILQVAIIMCMPNNMCFMIKLCTLQVFYTFLMYIEFGIGEWLEQRPFLYAIAHQVSLTTSILVTVFILPHLSAVHLHHGHVYW